MSSDYTAPVTQHGGNRTFPWTALNYVMPITDSCFIYDFAEIWLGVPIAKSHN